MHSAWPSDTKHFFFSFRLTSVAADCHRKSCWSRHRFTVSHGSHCMLGLGAPSRTVVSRYCRFLPFTGPSIDM